MQPNGDCLSSASGRALIGWAETALYDSIWRTIIGCTLVGWRGEILWRQLEARPIG